jgi:hypothetical protein
MPEPEGGPVEEPVRSNSSTGLIPWRRPRDSKLRCSAGAVDQDDRRHRARTHASLKRCQLSTHHRAHYPSRPAPGPGSAPPTGRRPSASAIRIAGSRDDPSTARAGSGARPSVHQLAGAQIELLAARRAPRRVARSWVSPRCRSRARKVSPRCRSRARKVSPNETSCRHGKDQRVDTDGGTRPSR